MLTSNFEIEGNFWKLNPQLCVPEAFKKLYTKDTSKHKDESSRIMWAIAQVYDFNSKLQNLTLEERKELVAKDYLNNVKFKWENYKEQIEVYEKLSLTPAKRQLMLWNRFMDEKTAYMSTLKFNAASSEHITELLLSNGKLFTELDRLTAMLAEEGEGGKVKGGSMESLSEEGKI